MSTKRSKNVPLLNRRAFLWGAGGLCLSLPWLEEFSTPAHAATIEDMPRYLSVFLPHGIPLSATTEGMAGESLSPLTPFKRRMSVFRGIDYVHGKGHQMKNNVFTGWKPHRVGGDVWEVKGDSIDQVLLAKFREAHPQQAFSNLHIGMRTSTKTNPAIRTHSWKAGGSQFEEPIEDPEKVFERITGGGKTPARAAEEASILDAVKASSESLLSERSYLGSASKNKVRDYMDELREVERRVQDAASLTCGDGMAVGEMPSGHWYETAVARMELLFDLMLLGMRCDPTIRFGTIGLGVGDDNWDVRDPLVKETFEKTHIHNAHHRGNEVLTYIKAAKLQMEIFAMILDRLARTADGPVDDMLSNTMVLLGSEMGDHSQDHNIHDVFHVIAGLDDRLRHDQYSTTVHTHVDLYTTAIRAFGVDQTHGDPELFNAQVSGLLGAVPDSVG